MVGSLINWQGACGGMHKGACEGTHKGTCEGMCKGACEGFACMGACTKAHIKVALATIRLVSDNREFEV